MWIFLALVSNLVFAAGPAGPFVEWIEGADTVRVVMPGRKLTERKEGDRLAVGEMVRGPARGAVRVLFPDYTQVIAGDVSDVELNPVLGGMNWVTLKRGFFRIKGVQMSAAQNGSKPRLGVRVPFGRVGAGAADFVVDMTGGVTIVYVFSGVVFVSDDDDGVIEGSGQQVKRGQMVQITESEITFPKAFKWDAVQLQFTKVQSAVQSTFSHVPRSLSEVKGGDIRSRVEKPETAPLAPMQPAPSSSPRNPFILYR